MRKLFISIFFSAVKMFLIGITSLLVMTAGFSGCNKEENPANTNNNNAANYEVTIQGNQFIPSILVIPEGSTVKWTNMDSYQHTVTSGVPSTGDGKFDSGLIQAGESYSFTFTTADSYNYFCEIHPFMTGSITVESNNSY
ncbi:MAG: hypothetical protein Kow0098_23260 [Ignavibacteriaceae bacterium]